MSPIIVRRSYRLGSNQEDDVRCAAAIVEYAGKAPTGAVVVPMQLEVNAVPLRQVLLEPAEPLPMEAHPGITLSQQSTEA